MAVCLSPKGAIAVVTVDNPPVNALSRAVREGLLDAVRKTEADPATSAVVLACAGRTFIAGADIREFGRPPVAPHLPDVLNAIEGAGKPWIAALHGSALGGGLETALSCHHRIAAPGTRLGLPEVTLGLIPGAGGTVRLPRLIPALVALKMIATGKPVSAEEAESLGLVDGIADDPVAAALSLARSAAPRPTLKRPVQQPEAPEDFEIAAAAVLKKARGQTAPGVAIEALRTALAEPPGQALHQERRHFLSLRQSNEAAALRHIFFAERATPGVDAAPRPLNRVGVIGGGTMGAGIAAACLLSGLEVTMVERDRAAADRGRAHVADILDGSLSRGLLTPESHGRSLARFRAMETYDLADTDLVIEAVFEDMAVKQEVFARLDEATGPETILASNTSYLDVTALAASTTNPARVLGLHFFSPAHIMKLLEIVTPPGVSQTAIATALSLARRLRKFPILSGVCDGFVANRIMARYRREAEYLLEDGALPSEVDAAMRDFGYPMGVFEVQDLAGLDIAWAMRKRRAATRPPDERYVDIPDKLCEAGRLGRKTGRGYYSYAGTTPAPDPELAALVEAESARKGITRRSFSDTEIMDRILSAMLDEAKAVLAEGIARSAADIDVAMVHGFGFPRWKGGPMFMAGKT